MIEINNLEKSYNDVTALADVSMNVNAGELVALYGPSGSGKTTLLQLIAGMNVPDKGTIKFFDEDISDWTPTERDNYRAKNIGYIFQSFNLIDFLTSRENIMQGAIYSGISVNDKDIDNILIDMDIPEKKEKKPSELSHGEKQRVGIARALIKQPSLVLADEPTGNLDTKTSKEIIKIMKSQVENADRTFIIATHDRMIADYADRILYLRDGVITETDN